MGRLKCSRVGRRKWCYDIGRAMHAPTNKEDMFSENHIKIRRGDLRSPAQNNEFFCNSRRLSCEKNIYKSVGVGAHDNPRKIIKLYAIYGVYLANKYLQICRGRRPRRPMKNNKIICDLRHLSCKQTPTNL